MKLTACPLTAKVTAWPSMEPTAWLRPHEVTARMELAPARPSGYSAADSALPPDSSPARPRWCAPPRRGDRRLAPPHTVTA